MPPPYLCPPTFPPQVKTICPNRQVQSELYAKQNCGPGSMTKAGLQQIWDLGRFTNRNYMKHAFVADMYDRKDIFVQASQSDRTLMSASAWGDTAFPRLQTLDYHSNIPVAVYSVPMPVDNLLEVRKARCEARIAADVAKYDQTAAQPFIKSERFRSIMGKVSAACGRDLMLTSNFTNGEFNVLDAVKDVSDAVGGDFLEGFPRMGGLSDKDATDFLQLAEDLFQNRLYHTPAQAAYLSGKLPEKIQSIFMRHVALTVPKTASQLQQEKEDLSAFGKLPTPRKFLAYHCHREVLYGIVKFLGISVTVPRPGLPDGLIHPGSGFFFELWEDDTVPRPTSPPAVPAGADEATAAAIHKQAAEAASKRFSVRVLLWTPCFEGDGVSHLDSKGERVCPARLRVLPQCGSEFCPLDKFNAIIRENFAKVGGDFRKQCENPELGVARELRGQIKLLQREVRKYKSLSQGAGSRRSPLRQTRSGTPRLIESDAVTAFRAEGLDASADDAADPDGLGSFVMGMIPADKLKPKAKAKITAALNKAGAKMEAAFAKAQRKSGFNVTAAAESGFSSMSADKNAAEDKFADMLEKNMEKFADRIDAAVKKLKAKRAAGQP